MHDLDQSVLSWAGLARAGMGHAARVSSHQAYDASNPDNTRRTPVSTKYSMYQLAALELLDKGQWPLGELVATAATQAALDYEPWRFFDLWLPRLMLLINPHKAIEVVGWDQDKATLTPSMTAYLTICGREIVENQRKACECNATKRRKCGARN